ncbi:MAG: hypothetical protein DCF22_13295 [Leptolyngbya sp.]|nr:MAG: hypothetical protein DCF22_13295 [Leptolyngbya sp.]
MELNSPLTDIILSQSCSTLCRLQLDWTPEPGTHLEIAGQTYLVLERRHRYMLKSGRYQLHQIALYVQTASIPTERSLIEGRWVIGDSTCLYNARSEILRCAINPNGPCDRCTHYQPLKKPPFN